MWVLKLELDYKNQLFGQIAHEFNLDVAGYLLSYYKKGNYLISTHAGYIVGEEKNKEKMFRFLKKSKKVLHCERNGDFVIVVSKQPLHMLPLYNPKLVRFRPEFISKDGYHIWYLASWERKDLEPVIKFAKKHYSARILKFKQEKISNIFFMNILPDISPQQKRAFQLAIQYGYYEYPKKTNLHKLAKIMRLSYSTFQEHLKRAELKMMPHFGKRLDRL